MPAKSKAQQKFLCSKSKKLCKEFAVSGKAYDKLPSRVKKKAKKKAKSKARRSR